MKKSANITEKHLYVEDDVQNMFNYVINFVKITAMMLISDAKELVLENLYSQGHKPWIIYNKAKRKWGK